jgi:tetratricopeptide (TPR) repeat protein
MSEIDTARWARATELFERALDLPPAQRKAWLLAQTEDAAVRAIVERWLAADEAAGEFLESPVAPQREAVAEADLAGTRFGAWRLQRRLGAGGMGKSGSPRAKAISSSRRRSSACSIRRPISCAASSRSAACSRVCITRTSRNCSTAASTRGAPYFVMEYVDGDAFTRHCEAKSLDLRARLDLFLQVCDGVDYAHRNLVVHRDLKPSNILVDAEGNAKLLDFGIAKLLDDTATAGETATAVRRLTPDYAAPEQIRGERVTTATDVYALGVILCEIIAGERPYQLAGGDLHRAIDTATPTQPSALALRAHGEPRRWASRLRGDLDRIVQTAIAREPQRRYASVAALADDVRRHLDGRPIVARGDDAWYRTRRFLARHRAASIAAALVVVTLVAATAFSLVQARRAAVERDLYRAEALRNESVLDYVVSMFRAAPHGADAAPPTARDLVTRASDELDRRFADRPADLARVVAFLSELFGELNDDAGAIPLQQRFLQSPAAGADPAMTAKVRLFYAQNLLHASNLDGAAEQLAQAQAFWNGDLEHYRDPLVRSRIIEGQIRKARGDVAGAIALYRAALPEAVAVLGADHDDTANIENSLALALMQGGELEEADHLMQHVLVVKKSLGRSNDDLVTIQQNLGAIAFNRGDYPRARQYLSEAVDERRKTFGLSGAMAAAELNLARTLIRNGEPDAALPLLDEARTMAARFIGPRSPIELSAAQSAVEAQLVRNDPTAAETALTDATQQLAAAGGEKSPLYANQLVLEGRLRAEQGRKSDADRLLDDAIARLQKAGASSRAALAYAQGIKRDIDAPH